MNERQGRCCLPTIFLDVMGCFGNESSKAEQQALKNQHKKIEKQLKRDKQVYRATHRLLLLGKYHRYPTDKLGSTFESAILLLPMMIVFDFVFRLRFNIIFSSCYKVPESQGRAQSSNR